MDIINKPIGTEGNVKVVVSGGKLSLIGAMDTSGVDANVTVSVDTDYFLDELAAKIPGGIDDAIIAVFKAALKQI